MLSRLPLNVLLVTTLSLVHPSPERRDFGILTYRVGEAIEKKVGTYPPFPVTVSGN